MHEAWRRLLAVAVVLHGNPPGIVGVPDDRAAACVFHQLGRRTERPARAAIRGGGDAEPPVPIRDEDDVAVLVPFGVGNAAFDGEPFDGTERATVVAFRTPRGVAERHVEDTAAIRFHEDAGIRHVVIRRNPVPLAERVTAVGGGHRHVDVVRALDGRRICVASSLPVGRHGECDRDRTFCRSRERNVHVTADRILALGGRVELRSVSDAPVPASASVVLQAVRDRPSVQGEDQDAVVSFPAEASHILAAEEVGAAPLDDQPIAVEQVVRVLGVEVFHALEAHGSGDGRSVVRRATGLSGVAVLGGVGIRVRVGGVIIAARIVGVRGRIVAVLRVARVSGIFGLPLVTVAISSGFETQ